MAILRSLSTVAVGIAMLAGALVVAPSSAVAAPASGWHRIRSVAYPNECMAVDAQTFTVVSRPCGAQASDQWYFRPTSQSYPAHYRELWNAADGRCLDAGDRGGRLTTRMATMPCNQSPNQAWSFGDPGTVGVGCVWIAYLCDWRPMNAKGFVDVGGGVFVYLAGISLQPNTSTAPIVQWIVEPVMS